MQFMIMRRADPASEAADFPPPELVQAMPTARWLHASASGARMRRSAGAWHVQHAPFAGPEELVAGFTLIEADSLEAAQAQAAAWPAADGQAVLEVREAGCPGGCVGFDTGEAPQRKAYAVLLRSDAGSEADLEPPPEVIATMNRANQAGARVRLGGGKASFIDGPFTEVKELIAGYWLIQADDLGGAMEWVRQYPYPHPDALEVELRLVHMPGRV